MATVTSLRHDGAVLMARARLVGINHVALEVGDLEEALAFWRGLFSFGNVDAEPGALFLDLGDQFLTLLSDDVSDAVGAHFGLVVDDKATARRTLVDAGIEIAPGPRLEFLDPFGNWIQVVQYDQIQFTKAQAVLRGMNLELTKSPAAIAELRAKGLDRG